MLNRLATWLVDPAGLPPHGFCLLWDPGLIWTQVAADIAVGVAYFAMSLALTIYARRRRDVAFRPLVWMFAAFIVLCGASHWIDALTVFVPAYAVQSLVKIATALVSACTAAALWLLLPRAIARPSASQFEAMSRALGKSESFLDRIGRLAGVGGWELDLATNAIYWSPETYRIHGVPAGYTPVLGEAINFYAPEARPIIHTVIARATEGGEGWDLELPFIRGDGRRIWVRTVGTVEFVDGKAARAMGAFQDVTERVAQRLAVQDANERATLATESAGIGVWERNLHTGAMIWDAYMHRIYGTARDVDVPTYESWRRHVHPDDLIEVELAIRASIDALAPYAAEFRIKRSDGSVRHIRALGRIVCDPAGDPAKIVGVNLDITESHRLAAQLDKQALRLAESEAKFRLLAENANDMIVLAGPDGTRRYISPAASRIFGVPPQALLDGNPYDLIHPDDAASVWALRTKLLAGPSTTATLVFRVLNPARGEVWVESSGRTLYEREGLQPAGYVAILRDVTDRVHAEQELRTSNAELTRLARHFAKARMVAEQANRAKTRFLASMSHELRTPLNGILGYAQLLRMDGALTETQVTRIDAMLAAGTHLLEMIHCVLDLSQIETEGTEFHPCAVDLRNIAEACLGLVRPTAEAKPLALRLLIDDGVPRCAVTDATRLRQVLLNLLGNAVKFTARGSVVLRVRTAQDETKLRFEVADTGPGIAASQRHRLFEAFERMETDKGAGPEGAGLGLSLSAQFAKLIGGRLGHEDNPGGGSVFWLELPLVQDSTEADSHQSVSADQTAVAHAAPIGDMMRLLVVDDVAMNRDIAAAFIRSAGHEAVCVEGGAEAVAAVQGGNFAAVLMDVRMPEVDGLEATRRIRALAGERGSVPIVALTAQVFTEQIDACREAGMDTHLAKPFTRETLLATIERCVAASPARRAVSPSTVPARNPVAALPDGSVSHEPRPGSHLPIVNQATLDQTVAMLPSAATGGYFLTLAEKIETLTRALAGPDRLSDDGASLVELTHALAGSAGMFGFERLVFAATEFEKMTTIDLATALAEADGLHATLQASLAELRRMTRPTALVS